MADKDTNDPKNSDTGDGGQGDKDGTNTDPESSKGAGQTGEDAPKTYTQAEVDALDKKLQKRYAQQGQKAFLEGLGIEDPDALKSLVEAEKARQESELSESQKATKAAEAEKAQAAQERAELAQERVSIALERALLRPGTDPATEPGLNPERLEVAMAIALPHAMSSDDADSAIEEAVAHTRATVPEVFGSPAGGFKPPVSSGTPGRTNGQRSTNKSGKARDGAADILEWQKAQKSRLPPPLPGIPPPN